MIELPSPECRAYLSAYRLAAVYVAEDAAAGRFIRPARDLERSFMALRAEWPEAVLCFAAWCDDFTHAKRIARRALEILDDDPSMAPADTITRAAAERFMRLGSHDETMARVKGAVAVFNDRFFAACRNGGLKFFNCEYQRRRIAALGGGKRFPTYAEASAKLRRFLIFSHARTGGLSFNEPTLLRFVFGRDR